MAESGRNRKRNWTELPDELTSAILSRLGAVDIIESAQIVCMKWRKIFKDPLMWRKIDMRYDGDVDDMDYDYFERMCRHAVNRGSGDLVDINIEYFGTDDLLEYITESSRRIRRLRLLCCDDISDGGLIKVASKLPLLEELDISLCHNISHKAVEMVGSSCPLLKSFKFNKEWYQFSDDGQICDEFHFSEYYPRHLNAYRKRNQVPYHGEMDYDAEALAIAGTMHGLRQLQLFGNKLTDDGLTTILDCCPDLCSLDLRHCFILNLEGDLSSVCHERIEKLWLPHDPATDGKEFVARSETYCFKWTELPDDVTVSILSRLRGIDILRSAQNICSKWFRICKDPLMWRTIDMRNNLDDDYNAFFFHELCERAIARSCGKLVDINIENFGTDVLLQYYLACRFNCCTGLKRLRLVTSHRITDEGFREVVPKFPLLEELDLSIYEDISHETLAVVGRSCPLLKSLKYNRRCFEDYNQYKRERNDCALAMAGTMPGLQHLMLFRNTLTNKGLCAILDGCPHLELLDLRQCFNLRLGGKVGRICAKQIKELRLPHGPVDDIDPSYEFVLDR